MKRSKPLIRRTPLRARTGLNAGKPLERTGELKRTSGPKPRSAKRAAEMDDRRAIYDWLRATHPVQCAWPRCSKPWEDAHEVHTRARGGSHIDRRVIIGLCRDHNRRAGDDPRAAECIGVVVPSWAADNDLDHAMRIAASTRLVLDQGDPQPCPWRRDDGACTSPLQVQRERCELLHGP